MMGVRLCGLEGGVWAWGGGGAVGVIGVPQDV